MWFSSLAKLTIPDFFPYAETFSQLATRNILSLREISGINGKTIVISRYDLCKKAYCDMLIAAWMIGSPRAEAICERNCLCMICLLR
jgi:hypothetical protein